MFETATAQPRFQARFPVKVPSFKFRGGGFISFFFKIFYSIGL